jgi:hypothetical protein
MRRLLLHILKGLLKPDNSARGNPILTQGYSPSVGSARERAFQKRRSMIESSKSNASEAV